MKLNDIFSNVLVHSSVAKKYVYYKQSINQNKQKMQYKKYKITKYLTTYYNKKFVFNTK